MSQTDKLISLTGLSRILNVIKEFVNNRISSTAKKIKHDDATVTLSGGLEIGSITLHPNEYTVIDNAWDVDELKISVPNKISGPTLSYSTNDYACEFTIPAHNNVKITLPSTILWKGGQTPSFISGSVDRTFVLSIVNGLGEMTNYSTPTAVTENEE